MWRIESNNENRWTERHVCNYFISHIHSQKKKMSAEHLSNQFCENFFRWAWNNSISWMIFTFPFIYNSRLYFYFALALTQLTLVHLLCCCQVQEKHFREIQECNAVTLIKQQYLFSLNLYTCFMKFTCIITGCEGLKDRGICNWGFLVEQFWGRWWKLRTI